MLGPNQAQQKTSSATPTWTADCWLRTILIAIVVYVLRYFAVVVVISTFVVCRVSSQHGRAEENDLQVMPSSLRS